MSAPTIQPPPEAPAATRRARRAAPSSSRRPTRPSLAERLARVREQVRPLSDPLGRVLSCVSGLGWVVLALAVVSWMVAFALGWREFAYAAGILGALLAFAALLTIGRMNLEVGVRVEPQRVVAGDSTAIEVAVRNVGKGPLLPVALDLATGAAVTRFGLPALVPGGEFSDVVVMPSTRRGVYQVGPARTRRGDPFGLVSREVTWTEPIELFVHPRTIYLEALGSGLLKDLEGRSTNDMSMSDLAFHTLREYAPGDDRRHIHWLSTAKRSGVGGGEEFMVRQFLDTRRSHIGVVVDCYVSSWVDEDEFETAVSGGASVVARALRDGQDVSEATGPYVLTRPKRHTALDLFSRARLGDETLETVAARLTRQAPNVSSVIFFVGPNTSFLSIRRAASLFGPDVNVVTVRIKHGKEIGLQRSGGRSIVTVGALADLPRALAGKVVG